MTRVKHFVTIKGVKDGLVFLLDDACDFAQLLEELQHKLDKTHQKILTGPIIHVHVKLGNRTVSEAEKKQIRNVISRRGNLLIQTIEAQVPLQEDWKLDTGNVVVLSGVLRSGQTVRHEGNLLYVGDVNPGGTIISSGDIFIMGCLRGMAHAGVNGNEQAVIAASYLRPTQLRIAEVISRPPDEWGIEEAHMEFAYIQNGKMEIDRVAHLHRLRSRK